MTTIAEAPPASAPQPGAPRAPALLAGAPPPAGERSATGKPSATAPRDSHDRLERRARDVPRLGRLLTSVGQLQAEVEGWAPAEPDLRLRRRRAGGLLDRALACAETGRVDDGWAYLDAADRASLARLDDTRLQVLADSLRLECAAKLEGWRAAAALSSLAEPGTDRRVLLPRVEAARELLDDDAQNTYLRLRLLGRRVAVATVLLALVMVALTLLVVLVADGTVPMQAGVLDEGVLADPGWFAQVTVLGALGAMLSAAISAMDHGSAPRVYELSTPLLATAVARVLVGSGAAVVTVMAAEVDLLPVMPDWLPVVAVVSGFSERLVRRVVATLSDAAEHTSPTPTRTPAPAGPPARR